MSTTGTPGNPLERWKEAFVAARGPIMFLYGGVGGHTGRVEKKILGQKQHAVFKRNLEESECIPPEVQNIASGTSSVTSK